MVNPDADKALRDYQMEYLERLAKRIQRAGAPNNPAEANVGFRLENAGDAFREIVSNGVEDYILEKVYRVQHSLVDSEWKLPLSDEGQQLVGQYRSLSVAMETYTPRQLAARDLLIAVSERDIPAIREAAAEVEHLTLQPSPQLPAPLADLQHRTMSFLIRSYTRAGVRFPFPPEENVLSMLEEQAPAEERNYVIEVRDRIRELKRQHGAAWRRYYTPPEE